MTDSQLRTPDRLQRRSHHRFLISAGLLALMVMCAAMTFSQSVLPDGNAAPQEKPQSKPTPTPTPRRPQPSELQKAVQEFRVQIGQIGEGGKLKSSGKQNSFTGRIYEYLRNDAFDALPHEVRQRGGTKSLLRRNQFGFTLSGPVRLPFVYDGRNKTFFSVSYEGTRERIAQSALFTIPTAGQRNGDFSDLVDTAGNPVTIYDPLTTRPNPNYDPAQPVSETNLQYLRDPFPNNRIPLNRLDPVAQALVAMAPQPNIAVGPFLSNNYFINNPFENRANGVIAKLDHALTAKQQLSLNLNTSSGLRKSPEFYSGPANPGNPSYNFENRALTLTDTYTHSPKTIWLLRVTAAHSRAVSLESAQQNSDYPRQLGLGGLFSGAFPSFRYGSYLGIGPRPDAVFRDSNYFFSPYGSVSLNRKEHTFRLSGYYRRSFVNSFAPYAPAGLFSFNNALSGLPGVRNTGNSFASFLLGLVNRAEESVVLHPSYYRKHYLEFDASDEYRMRPGLTASFSLSMEISGPRTEKYNRQSTVSFKRINPANGKPGAMIFAGRDGVGRGLQPTTVRFEPSAGLSWSPGRDRKTVVRMSYGLSYQDYPLYGRHFGTQGFNVWPLFTSPNDQLQPAFILSQGVPQNFQLPPDLTATSANGVDADYIDDSGLLPATQQWNLTVQRELPGSFSLEVNFSSARSTHLFIGSLVRLNAVPVENLVYRDQLYDDAFRNSLRPYPQFRNLDLGGLYPAGDARSNAMTVTLDKRLSAGLYGRVSYRFGKTIENASSGGAQDPSKLREEMSLAPYDIRHSLQLSYTYELPFGKGRPFLNNEEWVNRVLGGWSLSALTSVTGGTPLILHPLFNRTGGIVNNLRVNVVPGTSPSVENQNAQQWFNPAAFAQPDDFTLGNASRTHPQLRTPGDQFHHLSLTKRIELHGDTSLEFVTEAFNFPNHANLNDPDTRIGPADSPNLNAGKIIGSTGGRVMQLGLRILF
ncbi:MAG: hypothetical protein U0Z53_14265 [Blastocatellia bacterium]